MRLTLLLPTLNEAEGVERTIGRIPKQALEKAGYEAHVIIVDGVSKDGTAERAAALGATVIVEPRRGYGRAYKTGLRRADGDRVVTADADDTYPLDALPSYLAAFEAQKLDFASVDRFAQLAEGSMSPKHRFGNRVLSFASRALFGLSLHDSQSGMWILNRRALERIPLERFSDGMAFSQELKIQAFRDPTLRAAELPGRYYPRVGEAKLSSWRDGTRNLRLLVRHRFRRLPPGEGSH